MATISLRLALCGLAIVALVVLIGRAYDHQIEQQRPATSTSIR